MKKRLISILCVIMFGGMVGWCGHAVDIGVLMMGNGTVDADVVQVFMKNSAGVKEELQSMTDKLSKKKTVERAAQAGNGICLPVFRTGPCEKNSVCRTGSICIVRRG